MNHLNPSTNRLNLTLKPIGLAICIIIGLNGCKDFGYIPVNGSAYIIDDYQSRNPMAGLYVEAVYDDRSLDPIITNPTLTPLMGTITDDHGYFSFDTRFPDQGMIDNTAWALVYSDSMKSNQIGEFRFSSKGSFSNRMTIGLDTLCMPYNIWIVPRLANLGSETSDTILYRVDAVEVVAPSQKDHYVVGPFSIGQVLPAVHVKINFGTQEWLKHGSRYAFWAMYSNQELIHYSTYSLFPEGMRAREGDTVFTDIYLK
jgi:hypothetical protein